MLPAVMRVVSKNDLEIWDIISKLRPFEPLSSYRILNTVRSLIRKRLVAAINATPAQTTAPIQH